MNKGKLRAMCLTNLYIRSYIYGFIMMAKGQQIELYHHSKELVDKWIEVIKDSVILVDLKDDYIIAQMIGKGNFAKVHLCKRKADERTFALKSVEKTLIRKSKRNSVTIGFLLIIIIELNPFRNRYLEKYRSRIHN